MSTPLLEVRNLHVYFRTYEGTSEVINGIDFTVDVGETAAVVGETGCGKSVTARAILGLLPEAAFIPEGKVLFKGENLLEKSERERHALRGREMSMILQDPMTALNPVYTVGEQMVDVLKWQGRTRVGVTDLIWKRVSGDSKEHRERSIEMLNKVQIADPGRVFSSYPVELSGGMRQRVLIAMALLSEPEFLIADEPGTALDVTTEAKILQLLNELIKDTNASVIYITHDLGVAKKVSDDINVMYAGEIAEQAPTDDLFASPQHPYTRGLLDSIPKLASGIGSGIDGQLPDFTDPPTGCRFASRCPHAEPECREAYPYPRWTGNEHNVACHLYQGKLVHNRHESLAGMDVDIGEPPWQTDHRTARSSRGDD